MTTTPLLSLSVHEALTLEGTLIALHPDLFNDSSSTSIVGGGASSMVGTGPPTILSRQSSNAGVSSSNNNEPNKNGVNSSRLEVGNMLEIRVWDPLPSRLKQRKPPATKKRPSSPPPSMVSSKSSVSNSDATGHSTVTDTQHNKTIVGTDRDERLSGVAQGIGNSDSAQSTTATLEAAASSLQKTVSSNISLQYSAESSVHSSSLPQQQLSPKSPRSPLQKDLNNISRAASIDDAGDASTLSSVDHTKDESLSPSPKVDAAKVPVKDTVSVPRTVITPTSSSGGLPPLPDRRTTVDGIYQPRIPPGTSASGGYTKLPKKCVQPILSSNSPRPVHERNISDVTAETFGHNLTDGTFLSTIDLGMQASGDSGDDIPTNADEIDMLSKVSKTHGLRLSFCMLVTEKTLTSIKGTARTQVSILRQVADLYKLSSYDMVTITKIRKSEEGSVLEKVSADFVMVTIKDQFISRGDMYYFQKTLLGRWIYEGERLSDPETGVRAHAREIRHANQLSKSGIITSDTVITFRSRSARVIWLVQISSEMWEYASPFSKRRYETDEESSCEIYFDKFVKFMHTLFEKWKKIEASHSLTVVFFSRTFLDSSGENKKRVENVDVHGRLYEDHYKTVIENESVSDWDSLVVRIKSEFVKFPLEVGWNLSTDGSNGRRPSNARQGNILEAINVTLNLLHFHYMDRDLARTGNSIVIVSPGCGVFEVDKSLAGITYQRMMDDGIGSDMLSLGLPPLHIAPFFLYNNEAVSVDTDGVDADKTYYEVPHWMHLSFVSYDEQDDGLLSAKNEDQNNLDGTVFSHSQSSQQMSVAANGFLLPEVTPEPYNKDKGFSSAKSASLASPNASSAQTQQHALISSRDFKDILEACQPKDAVHSLPPALVFLLQLYRQATKNESKSAKEKKKASDEAYQNTEKDVCLIAEAKVEGGDNVSAGDQQLEEWCSVNFDDGGFASTAQVTSNTILPETCTPMLLQHIDHSDRSESSDKSSPSSSFASVYSHMMLKPWERGISPVSSQFYQPNSFRGWQIKRSRSIEFGLPEFVDGFLSEDSEIASEAARFKDSFGRSKYGSDEILHQKADYQSYLRSIMSQHDSEFFSQTNYKEKSAPANTDTAHTTERNLDTSSHRSSHILLPAHKPGGIEAALVQYNDTDDQVGHFNTDMRRHNSFGINRSNSFGILSAAAAERGGSLAASPSSFAMIPSSSDIPDIPFLRFGTGLIPPEVRPGLKPRTKSGAPGGLTGVGSSLESDNLQYSRSGHRARPTRSTFVGGRQSVTSTNKPLSPTIEYSPSSEENQAKPANPIVKGKVRHNRRQSHHITPTKPAVSSQKSRQRKSIFNPFRQQDEEKVLAEKTHNRRRWSHVFSKNEIEFKRHTGPNWRSLCQPAILPLTIDFHPSPQELKDEKRFYFNPYSMFLGAMENSLYTTHIDLLNELVRQRLIQDYQVVPQSVITESTRRGELNQRKVGSSTTRNEMMNVFGGSGGLVSRHRLSSSQTDDTVQHTLSMGHKIHVLTFQPSSDTIEVVQYYASSALHDRMSVYDYRYLLYSKTTKKYSIVVQNFKKYSDVSRWNSIDNMICGDSDKTFSEEMRYRRIMFGLIPDHFSTEEAEQEFVDKFKKLLDYLCRLKNDPGSIDVQVIRGADRRPDRIPDLTKRRGSSDSVKRFMVDLKTGKDKQNEWFELVVDQTFDTKRTYRICVNWLVASSKKIEEQVKRLRQRCKREGLNLFDFPQLSISPTIFLNPFVPPPMLCVKDKESGKLLDDALIERNFVNDGIHMTEPSFMNCIEDVDVDFNFPMSRFGKPRNIPARQYAHRSATLFIRLLRDEDGRTILVGLENTRKIGVDKDLRMVARKVFQNVSTYVKTLSENPNEGSGCNEME